MALTLTDQDIQTLINEGYRYIRTLGQGHYGVVLLTRKNERKLALKVTRNIKSFQSEVRILTHLGEHPNIVRYYGSWSTRTLHGINLGYIAGRSLLDILTENRLSELRAHFYFFQLISAITHAHEVSGIVHRDLKVENLMISTGDTRLYVIDWGMSIEWSSDASHSQSCGSLNYAAPEIYKKQAYLGPEVDIWAMGVILYAMVTSNFPFPGKDPVEIGYRVCKGVYTPPLVSAKMCDLISKMLETSQIERITLAGVRSHPWFRSNGDMLTEYLVHLKT
jgi:serine/threonine protein kinase